MERQSAKKCYSFFYGGVEPIRFDVRDFRADSRGMHLSISSSDPTIVDIYYMLVSGNKSVYITREQGVPITGGFSTPVQKDYVWRQILENNKYYTGRAKIVELNHNQVRTFMNSFLASDDAVITETYQDETGASATVVGNSRVPFEGKLVFILSQNGTVLSTTEERTPVLLTGDDETVEISWNKTLEPGIYQLRTILLGQGGDIKDMEENIIEAKSIVRASNITDAQKTSPHPAGAAAVAMIAIALIRRRRLRENAISGDGINAKIAISNICILVLLALVIPAAIADDNQNNTQKVLRAGFINTKPVNDLDVYGSRAVQNLGNISNTTSVFNASQRLGMVGKISYNTSIYKPLYNISEYSRTKPTYQVPSSLSSRPVYDIENYPVIKSSTSIP